MIHDADEATVTSRASSCATDVLKDRRGATFAEYALLASLIAIVAVGTLKTFGTNLKSEFNVIASSV